MSKEDVKTIELRIADARGKMTDALNAGKFAVAETYLDQITSLKRMLELAA